MHGEDIFDRAEAVDDVEREMLGLLADALGKRATLVGEHVLDEVEARREVVGEAVGLPVSKMSDDQKKLMQELLGEYLKNLPVDVEAERLTALNSAGLDKITFAWYGEPDLHQAHHYRVQGPTFVIEYNNTQNNANHVHSMWRNLAGDFGLPAK